MNDADWVPGDLSGLAIPAHATALRIAGERFLTDAFRAGGALSAENRVVAVTRCDDWAGGSTGRKLLLSVAYAQPAAGLPTDLFVKFSRDFDDPIRDRARRQMASEVRFAAMSRVPGFPIAVPACLFADYHAESGSGLLITERIAFGTGRVERHYEKCLDTEMPEPVEHYRALIKCLARLAGAHKAGRLPDAFARHFAFDPDRLTVGARIPYTAQQLQDRVARFVDFAVKYPSLVPAQLAAPEFIARLADEAARFPAQETRIRQFLNGKPELIALCHWNANVDNAWFWRNAGGELECGLLDWGNAGQMNVAMALWGAMSAAELDLWDHHSGELLALFAAEFTREGGPTLDLAELKLHLQLYIITMGLAWMVDMPALLEAQTPDLASARSRFDPRIRANEAARVRLQMLTTFLHLWQTEDFGAVLGRFIERS
jgi:hypothetical protein